MLYSEFWISFKVTNIIVLVKLLNIVTDHIDQSATDFFTLTKLFIQI